MPIVYVQEQGAIVRKRGARLLIEKDDQLLAEIHFRTTEAVGIFGNVQVTTQALSELLERGIPLALYTRHGRLKGHIVPEAPKNVDLRIAQYRASLDGATVLQIAKAIVRAKLRNSAAMLSGYQSNYACPALAGAMGELERLAASLAQASAMDQVLGIEGAGAAAYFAALRPVNRSDLPFDGRRKHPATDPVNALLSLGYTMAMNEIRSLAEGAGLEPHVGFLHAVDYGRPSLALDLLEPFRSIFVDRLTWMLINERVLVAADFATRAAGPRAGSVVLMPDAFKRYIEAYERESREDRPNLPGGVRKAMAAGVETLCAALRNSTAFEPYMEPV